MDSLTLTVYVVSLAVGLAAVLSFAAGFMDAVGVY